MPGGHGMGLGRINYTGEDVGSRKVSRAKLRRVFSYFLSYRGLIASILLCVALSALIGLMPPLVIRSIIDQALPQRDNRLLSLLIMALFSLPLLEGLLNVLQQYLNTRVGQGIMRDLRVQLYHHLQEMSLRFFTQRKTGEVISRLTADVAAIQNVVTRIFVTIATNLIVIGSTVVVIFMLDWKLSLLSLLAMPMLIAPVRRVGKIRQRLRRRAQEEHAQLTSLLQETFGISGAIQVKLFGQEARQEQKFADQSNTLMDLEVRSALVGRWFMMFVSLAAPFSAALVFWVGGRAVIAGTLTIGTIIAFTAYLARLYAPLSQLLNIHIDLLTALAVFERLFEYLDLEPEIQERDKAVALPLCRGHISFENVSFAYERDDWTLKGISFRAEPGQLVALVGPSGAGKTTVTYLLLRLYDPLEGTIKIDDHDIRNVTLRSLRTQLGMAMQEPFLFHTTVRENLLFANPDATEEELFEACQGANIHELISSLPQGYDTVVGERGYKFSGGEKQRIALARVFLKNPRILILDEATSAVDSESEASIQAAMERLMKDRTTLVIAHRLSTIHAADQILVMDKGRLVESGTHGELLAKGELYSRLYNQQYKRQELKKSEPVVVGKDLPEPE